MKRKYGKIKNKIFILVCSARCIRRYLCIDYYAYVWLAYLERFGIVDNSISFFFLCLHDPFCFELRTYLPKFYIVLTMLYVTRRYILNTVYIYIYIYVYNLVLIFQVFYLYIYIIFFIFAFIKLYR